jgi:hypothetical protein
MSVDSEHNRSTTDQILSIYQTLRLEQEIFNPKSDEFLKCMINIVQCSHQFGVSRILVKLNKIYLSEAYNNVKKKLHGLSPPANYTDQAK